MWISVKMSFIPVMRSCISASLLQCHMIFRNHNNMLICCLINNSDYYQCWKQSCCTIFLLKSWYILFFRSLKWIENSTFIRNLNILSCYECHFNASLLNKSMNLLLASNVGHDFSLLTRVIWSHRLLWDSGWSQRFVVYPESSSDPGAAQKNQSPVVAPTAGQQQFRQQPDDR